MITEPEFPHSFLKFISSILTQEKEADKTKAQIDPASIQEIYQQIDTLETGHIFLEDFYTFMKLHNVSVSKRELKFLNKYFGFDSKESLTMEEFKSSFLQIRDPKSITENYCESSVEKFIEYITLVINSYSKIEDLRALAADDLEELKSCLQKYYSINGSVLTKEITKECLCDMGLYSRLNLAIVCHYVIGDEAAEVNLKQLFWKEGQTANIDSKLQVRSPSKIEIKVETKTPIKKAVPTNSKSQNSTAESKKMAIPIILKTDSNDILSQIENIESTIRYKKQIYAQRSKNIELDEQTKQRTIGTLIKRTSTNSSVDNSDKKQKKLSKFGNDFSESQLKMAMEVVEKKIEDEEECIEPIVNQSKKAHRSKYSFEMSKEDDAPYEMRDIDDLLKNRMSVKTKEQVLNKAATCAQLKIQQIEKRVMGKLTNKTSSIKASDYSRPLVSDLRSHYSGQLRSRYSSLKRE